MSRALAINFTPIARKISLRTTLQKNGADKFFHIQVHDRDKIEFRLSACTHSATHAVM